MSSRSKSRRSGTIAPKGEGKWLVRVSQGRDPVTGKWLRQSWLVQGTRRDAERALTSQQGKQDQGILPPKVRLTLHDWLEQYKATWSGGLASQTKENAEQLLKCYVPASLKAKHLQALRPADFQTLYNSMSARGLAPATVGAVHRVLRSRLNEAVNQELLAKNPILKTKLPAKRPAERRVFSPAEALIYLEEAESDEFSTLWILLLQTGLRPAEALGLRWEDIAGDRLTISRTLVRLGGGGWELQDTKTGDERGLTLPADVVKSLTRQKARQAERRLLLGQGYVHNGFLFANDFGHPLHWTNLAARHFAPLIERVAHRILGQPVPVFDPKGLSHRARSERYKAVRDAGAVALEKTGLDKMRPYDLRHSAATLLLAAGESPKLVSVMLGHANIGITMDLYSHVIPDLQASPARSMERVLASARTGARTAAN